MKLGIIQTDPSEPDTLKIVNQGTGEVLENIVSYEIREVVGEVQYLTVTVINPRKYKKSCEK